MKKTTTSCLFGRPASGLGLLIAWLLILAPFSVESAEVVAKIGETDVTLEEVRTLLRGLDPAVRRQIASDRQGLEKLVRSYATQSALYEEARGKKWDERAEVRARVVQATREAVVRSYLDSVTTPPSDYPSDADVQTVYDENKERFMTPRAFHLASIYVPSPSEGDAAAVEAARKKALDLVRKARAKGADFAALADANSADPEQRNGGDLGFLTEEDLQPESRKVVLGMKDGEVSDPIPTATGFHILRLIETKPAAVRPLGEVSEQIRAIVRQNRQEKLMQEYVAKLLEANPISIDQITLDKAGEESLKR